MNTSCPECAADVEVPDDTLEGELLICDRCAVELEVISLEPLKVELFEEEEK